MAAYNAVVIGSGPNGLAAGITLARAGLRVLIVEAKATIGGGMRTAELTLPGFHHDICSAVHPMGMLSPFFQSLPLHEFGLEWVMPEVLLGHPLDNGSAGIMRQDLAATVAGLPPVDRAAWQQLFGNTTQWLPKLLPGLLAPPLRFPKHPILMSRFGLLAAQPATFLAKTKFRSPEARALFIGNAAHSILPLDQLMTSAIGLMLATAGHLVGWPVAKTGSQSIADAMGAYFQSLGGKIQTETQVQKLAELPTADAYFFDTAPQQMAGIAAEQLPSAFQQKLRRYRHGAAAYKLDMALSGPIPWKNHECRLAGTVHVGGSMEEIVAGEKIAGKGPPTEKPYVLLAQQSVCDPTRAPAGQHTCWAYAHVPSGYTGDYTEQILAQIERFAPGFRQLILQTHLTRPLDFQRYNPSYLGGDVIGGVTDLRQILARPMLRWDPYTTPNKQIYLCSASTPPGGGVHGMCGFHAANSAIAAKRFS